MRVIYALGDDAPEVHPTAWVAGSATVVGQVTLGAEASVWFGAVLRGDDERIEVGARTNVQDGAVLHADPGFPCVLGEGVTVGHNATVHGCTVGEGSLVGIGAVILNGARIGRHCLIGAGAFVPQHREIPDGSVVLGSPGTVRRTLTDKQRDQLARAAAVYVDKARRFRASLRVLQEG